MPDQATIERVDTAIHVAGLLVRGAAYAIVGSMASSYSCGQAILTGLLLGDLSASVLRVCWQAHDNLAQPAAELALLGLIYLWARSELVWPDDQATRAIIGLAALGVFAARAGGSVLTRLGPSEHPFG